MLKFRAALTALAVFLTAVLCSCSINLNGAQSDDKNGASSNNSSSAPSAADSNSSSASESAGTDDMFTSRDLENTADESAATNISLGDSVKIEGSGASADGTDITISKEGVYCLSGKLADGRIIVDCADENAKVQLVLKGAEIKCSDYAPIYVKSADKLFLTTAEGSDNTIEDGGAYSLGADDSNVDGAVFSKATLTLNGLGTLNIKGTQKHAVVSKDDIKVTGGTVNIEAVEDALQGKDSVRICGGEINIKSGEDGIKTSNDEDDDKGFVYISGGQISINAGDDGIHADRGLEITGGTIDVSESYEGIEGASIDISGGDISVVSSDDGINVSGGSDEQVAGDRPPEFANIGNASNKLTISGGYVLVNSGGDGLDSNGTMLIEGGVVLVSGPEIDGNGAIDYEMSAEITGGTLIAVGCAGMAAGFSENSTQNSFMTNLSSMGSADSSVAVVDEDGNIIVSFTSPKQFQNVVASSPKLELNKEYKIILGADISGADKNGYTDSGSYSGGSEDSSITLSSVATNNGGGMGGPGGMGGQGGMDGFGGRGGMGWM